MKTVGIVGGGQLGRMMAMEAKDLDVEIFVLDPTPNCPASEFATQVEGDFSDKNTVLEFGKDKDVLTFEIESANADALIELEERGIEIHPSPKTLSIIKDKFKQKEFLTEHGIPVGSYAKVESSEDVKDFAKKHDYPVVLKSRRGAYDGCGNRTVENEEQIESAMSELGEGLYIEAWVPFSKELAVVVARGQDGTVYPYPVVETIHTDHICDLVASPADVDEKVAEKASALSAKIMEVFHGAGVFGIEMFLTKEGEVLINEIAPRVHNSGHLTLGGANISQFKQHVLAVLGESLVEPLLKGKAVIMKNILGTRNAPAKPTGIEGAEALGALVEIYGKHDTKVKRKMGHVTVVGESPEEVKQIILKAHSLISI
ncbi:5-(carboxyamino)imidazole ribonucleotide synthase [Candidatus Kaiserbacteria bacterium]|nr:5-(carboxyamino)imidazole ribonucleotide synthase [Candidatus Kaiserbacteria bacterium]